jgi:hypothetical protein
MAIRRPHGRRPRRARPRPAVGIAIAAPGPGGRQPPGTGLCSLPRGARLMTGLCWGRPRAARLLRVAPGAAWGHVVYGSAPRADGGAGPSCRNGRLAIPFLVMWQAEVPPPNLAILRRRSRPQGARVRVLGVASGAGPSHGDGGPAPGPSYRPGAWKPNRSARWVKGVAVSVLGQDGSGTRATPEATQDAEGGPAACGHRLLRRG